MSSHATQSLSLNSYDFSGTIFRPVQTTSFVFQLVSRFDIGEENTFIVSNSAVSVCQRPEKFIVS